VPPDVEISKRGGFILSQEVSMTHKVELIRSQEGYAVLCPDLPGCVSQGATEEEALANIRDAIKDYLEVVEEMKQRREIRYVEVAIS
jgi:predicted RNase H-like HicB family nuclease